ncbi:MAG: hypothetical protein SGI88_08045 [Candidatus Hydrogenedentes bacterium]|nr:hypothetical protein [Candidatus Hydrogenedentota bacterium]
MISAKEEMKRLIDAQPDDISYEELAREIIFSAMVKNGLRDSDSRKTYSEEEMEGRIQSWARKDGI